MSHIIYSAELNRVVLFSLLRMHAMQATSPSFHSEGLF